MARQQRNYPYIYGYKALFAGALKDLNDVIKPAEENVLDVLDELDKAVEFNTSYYEVVEVDDEGKAIEITNKRGIYIDYFKFPRFNHYTLQDHIKENKKDYYKVSGLNLDEEQRKNYNELVALIIVLLHGWYFSVKNELLSSYREARVLAYLQGVKDGAWKLKQELQDYEGLHSSKIPELVRAINNEANNKQYEDISTPRRNQIRTQATSDVASFDYSSRVKIATTVAAIYVLKTPGKEEKRKQAEKKVKKLFRNRDLIYAGAVNLVTQQLAWALRDYYRDHSLRFHEWIIDNPEDTPCIMANGEIVAVGEPFSNGFLWGGDVHRNCHCTTVPAHIDDRYVENLLDYYGIDYE